MEKVNKGRKAPTAAQVIIGLNLLLTAFLLVNVPFNAMKHQSNAERISKVERDLADWRKRHSTSPPEPVESHVVRLKRESPPTKDVPINKSETTLNARSDCAMCCDIDDKVVLK